LGVRSDIEKYWFEWKRMLNQCSTIPKPRKMKGER
jgi:hypothetical protein